MDIFFADPNEVPLPPGEVRINRLEANALVNARRVHVYLELTPFQKRPNGELSLINAVGDELANISFIETMDRKMEFTLHLRGGELKNPYTLSVWIYYEEDEPASSEHEDLLEQRNKIIVDQAKTMLEIA